MCFCYGLGMLKFCRKSNFKNMKKFQCIQLPLTKACYHTLSILAYMESEFTSIPFFGFFQSLENLRVILYLRK